ncbi:MAG: helix-turn-helix domain-containing protein, partial [Nitrospirota bacterium]|nr:helix-turn-helix domain-containing protein [Nitrospirota bacterium]
MSVEAMTWAFTVDLPPCPKSVLVALANRSDEDGYCWPGIGDLERRTGWKTRAIQVALRRLVEEQLISVSPRFKASLRQDSNLYRLNVGAERPTTACGEGAADAPIGVHQVRGEGAPHAPGRVHQVRGEGAPHAPKSSSEQSDEQSIEQRAVVKAVPAIGKQSAVVVQALFDEFWRIYPHRNGKKLEREATRVLFFKLSSGDQLLAITAAGHYAASLSQQGCLTSIRIDGWRQLELWGPSSGLGSLPGSVDAVMVRVHSQGPLQVRLL